MLIYNDDKHMNVSDAVAQALDDELISDYDIFALADKYIRGSDIIDLFYNDLYSDLCSDVEDKIEEDEALEESKKPSRNYKLRSLKEVPKRKLKTK